MRAKRHGHGGLFLLPGLALVLVAIWLMNLKTLGHSVLFDTLKISAMFLACFVPLSVLLYFLANRNVSGKTSPWRVIHVLDVISRHRFLSAFAAVVVALVFSAIQGLHYSLLVLCALAISRAFLGAFAEPYINAEKHNHSSQPMEKTR